MNGRLSRDCRSITFNTSIRRNTTAMAAAMKMRVSHDHDPPRR
jgi:hypothetical protein